MSPTCIVKPIFSSSILRAGKRSSSSSGGFGSFGKPNTGTISSGGTGSSSGRFPNNNLGSRMATLRLANGRKVPCKAVGIFYSTTTGNTEAAAEWVKDLMPGETSEILDVGQATMDEIKAFDGLIVGAPTWHTGADTDRSGTDWDSRLDEIRSLSLGGKPVAVFGLGDAGAYGDNFCDAIEEIHDAFAEGGAKMIGYVPVDGYDFVESKSVRDGKFLGLPLDANNEDDMTESRVKKWTEQLVTEGMK